MSKIGFFENLSHDVRFWIRTCVQHPAFTAIVVLTLALGIGVNTAIFSLVNGVLLRPLPYAHPEQIVKIWDRSLPKGSFAALRERLQTMEVATYAHESGFNLMNNGEAIRVVADGVSGNIFSVVGVSPQLGRDFVLGDEAPGLRPAIISHDLWQAQFGGDPRIIGRHIMLDENDYEIVGVMPPGFNFPVATQIWAVIDIDPSDVTYWGWGYNVIARLRPGIDITKARSEFKTVFPQMLKLIPFSMPTGYGANADLAPFQQFSVARVRTMLLALLGAVFLILLVACVNVANLLLARSAARQKEMAVRAALGAGRRRIIFQLLTESVLLGVIGGTLGSTLGLLSLNILKRILPADIPRLAEVHIDTHVLAFAAILSFAVGLVFGMVPALQASRPDIEQTLKANAQAAGHSGRRSKTSAILVIAEVAMAVVLVSGAGLLIKSLWLLSNMNTGVQQEDELLIANVTPSWAFYEKNGQCAGFYRQVLESVRHLPGIRSAALTDTLPLENFFGAMLAAEDQPETTASPYSAWTFLVSPGYLNTMGIPLLRGRDFTSADRKNMPSVALISRVLAQAMWPGQDPIGKRLRLSTLKDWKTVVGVVEDVQHYSASPVTFNTAARGDVYFPSAQGLSTMLPYYLDIVVRAQGNIPDLQKEITRAIAGINSTVPVSRWRTMRQVVSQSISRPRSTTWLFMIFAALALLLGVTGIYSVISYSVVQRTREIGVRMALGADRFQILKMMVKHGAALALIGLVLGIAGAMAVTRWMTSLLYGVTPSDPEIYAIVAGIVALAAVLATYIPSRRATKVNPTVALRCE